MPRKIDRKTAAAVFHILAKYQAIETSRQGIRPDLPIEVGGEERYQLSSYDRLKAIAINRNLNRSNSKALTIIGNRCVLAFGKVRARFASSDEEWNKKADEYFNVDFARDCRYDEPQHFAEVVQGIERALMLEGDVLVSFDDWLADTGKLLIWEADQLCEVSASDWEKNAPEWARDKEGKPYPQKNGVIRSKDGRLAGFIVCRKELASEKSGILTVGIDEATFIPADTARLIKNRAPSPFENARTERRITTKTTMGSESTKASIKENGKMSPNPAIILRNSWHRVEFKKSAITTDSPAKKYSEKTMANTETDSLANGEIIFFSTAHPHKKSLTLLLPKTQKLYPVPLLSFL